MTRKHTCPGAPRCVGQRVQAHLKVKAAIRLLREVGAHESARTLSTALKSLEGAIRHALRIHRAEAQ